MTALPLFPDASPLGPPAARASDGGDPVAPAAGELPRVLPGDVVEVLGRPGLYRVRFVRGDVAELVGDTGYLSAALAAVRGVA